MATTEDLIKQYETDSVLRKEIDEIVKDGKITPVEFLSFASKHDLDISLTDLPKVIEEAKEAGLIK